MDGARICNEIVSRIKINRLIVCFMVCNFLIMAISIPTSFGFSQNPEIKFDRISLEQGLSENVALCLAQDERGFVWIGTQDGLNRYDGYTMKVFRNDLDDPRSLSNSYIAALYTDRSGTLWVGTAQGLNKFDREKEIFIRYRHDPQNPNSLSNDNITTIYEDRAGMLWVGTDGGGLNRWERDTGHFVRYQHLADDPVSISHNSIRAFYEDRKGIFWIGTVGGGLNRFDQQTGQFTHFQTEAGNPRSISHDSVTAICEDRTGGLWIGTDGGGLNRLDRETGQFVRFKPAIVESGSLRHKSISQLYEDRTGVLWIGTNGGGVYAYEHGTGKFTNYKYASENRQSLSNDLIVSILEDEAGILWFGTQNGVSKFDRSKQKFPHYRHHPGKTQGLSDNYVSSISKDSFDILWVGTLNGGLNRFDARTQRFTHYKHDPGVPESISDNTIYSLLEDRAGRLWIGTQNGGLNRFDRKTESFVHYGHSPGIKDSLSHNFVWPIYEDSTGVLWVGTWGGGLDRFDPQTEKFVHFKYDPDNANSLSNNQIACIIEGSSGKLWIGTFQGLNSFDPKTDLFTRYLHSMDDPQSLSNNSVASLYEDRSGRLWVGTLGGLNLFDRDKGNFKHYRKTDGLPNEVITSIMEDKLGMLWISSFNGISKFDPEKEVFINFDVDDGLQSRRFRANAHFQAQDGQMFFGGINGLNAFYPEQIKDNLYIPPVVLTDFQLFNHSLNPTAAGPLRKTITEANRIDLSYKDAVFSFEFAALHFAAPDVIQYAYQLEGFDQEWLYTDAHKRFATYTNIDGGTYIFRVKGTNSDGVWNEKGSEIKIVIEPPFWETGWFSLFSVGAVFAVLGFTATYLLKLKHEISERTLAENALVKSEEKYRDLIDNAPDLRYRTDMEGKIIFISPSVLNLSGYTVDEAIGMNMAADVYAYPEDRRKFLKVLRQEGAVTDFEAQLKRKDGSIWWASTNAHFYKDGDGNTLGVEGVTRDVTDRKLAEEALHNEKEFTDTALNSQQDTFFLFESDTGKAIRWNRAFNEISGYSDEEIAKMVAPDAYYSPEDMERAETFIPELLEAGTGTIELNLICKDGRKVPTEYKVSVMENEDTQSKYFISIGRDITERKKSDDKLTKSEQKYRLLADNISDNIWMLDIDSQKITYVSPSVAGITGYSAEEVMGLHLQDVLTPTSLALVTRVLSEEMMAEDLNADPSRFRTLELEQYRKDGTIVWTEASMRFVYDTEGRPTSVMGVSRDVSERKRLQNQLQKAQKMESLGLMAGGIAHDLNNILSGIVSYPDLLLMDLHADSPLRKPIETIKESGNRAADMVADLLTVTRGATISKTVLNLNTIVTDYIDSVEQKNNEKLHPAVVLNADLEPELLNINSSPTHLKKSLMNLAINSYESIEGSGTVTISTMNRYLDEPLKGYEVVQKGEYVVLTVSDDGSGISPEDLERIFEPFYTKKEMGRSGTGLGLTVVWNTVQDHNGYINVKSGDRGTAFELYFPVSREDLLTKKGQVPLGDFIGNGERILVVDDETRQREIASALLKKLNYSAEAVSSGEKAVEYLKSHSVDLIVLDMIMPKGLNGRETYEQIIKIYPNQKAIITSGFSENEEVKAAQRLGVGKYIRKPYSLEKIGLAVKEALKNE